MTTRWAPPVPVVGRFSSSRPNVPPPPPLVFTGALFEPPPPPPRALQVVALVLLLVVFALALASCAPLFWAKERVDCGIRCPANASCEVVSSGVFSSTSDCVCKHGLTKAGFRSPSKGDPCPEPTPTPCPPGQVPTWFHGPSCTACPEGFSPTADGLHCEAK